MRTVTDGKDITKIFDSVAELADHAAKYMGSFTENSGSLRPSFHGVTSWNEAYSLAINGWKEEAAEALQVAERAISKVKRDVKVTAFSSLWDVTGSEVDISRYLAGEPENMIYFEPVPTTNAGRVIALCASVAALSDVSTNAIKQRGQAVVALTLALAQLGYGTELWADSSVSSSPSDGARRGYRARMRTLIKGANDELDPARIMFAYAHPAMLRALCVPSRHSLPSEWRSAIIPGGYGYSIDPKQDLPDGTIYLRSISTDRSTRDPDEFLLTHLRELGIIED